MTLCSETQRELESLEQQLERERSKRTEQADSLKACSLFTVHSRAPLFIATYLLNQYHAPAFKDCVHCSL